MGGASQRRRLRRANRARMAAWVPPFALALALAFAPSACHDDAPSEPPQPVPGDLAVSVISPNGAEGAALFETSDPGITGVSAATGQVFLHQVGATTRIIVILDSAGDIAFTISVEDLNEPPVLDLLEVAAGDNALRADPSGYQVEALPLTEAVP